TTPGVQVDTLLDAPSSPVTNIASLTFDQNGKLLVSDRDGGKIYRVDVDSDLDEVIVDAGVEGGLFTPAGMVVDAAGDILVANLFGSSILKYDTDGNNGELFADVPLVAGDVDGGSFPSDLIVDRDGDLVVAVLGGNNVIGSGEGRVLRFNSAGILLQTLADKLAPASSVALIEDVLPGDFNGDGTVDEDDYAVWKSQYDDSVTPTHGADANGDGVVDADDFTAWRDTLGASGIATSANLELTLVPEPSSILLFVLGGLLLLSRRRLEIG
ncbi:MAG: dockerin type I domain-containing protein, partial [Aeoliella sp.]